MDDIKYRSPDLLDNDSILLIDGIEKQRSKYEKYSFQCKPIPRVNEILKEVFGKEYLVRWAAKLGDEEYNKERKYATTIGSFTHEVIEYFLLYGKDKNIPIYNKEIRECVTTSYKNFKNWYQEMIDLGYILTPLFTEVETTNPWFGGTIDLIMNIKHSVFNLDANFVIDFKTSKSISVEYILQTYAYLWSWNWNREFIDCTLPFIDGLGIIRIDKYKPKHDHLFITDTYNHNIMMSLCYDLGSMINWYYSQINANYQLSISKKLSKESNLYGEVFTD